jgi:hypothetical protein
LRFSYLHMGGYYPRRHCKVGSLTHSLSSSQRENVNFQTVRFSLLLFSIFITYRWMWRNDRQNIWFKPIQRLAPHAIHLLLVTLWVHYSTLNIVATQTSWLVTFHGFLFSYLVVCHQVFAKMTKQLKNTVIELLFFNSRINWWLQEYANLNILGGITFFGSHWLVSSIHSYRSKSTIAP